MEKTNVWGMLAVVGVAAALLFAPGVFRLMAYALLFVAFCYLCMEVKSGQDAKAELRRLKKD